MQKRIDLNGGIDCMRPDAGPTDSKELKRLIILTENITEHYMSLMIY